MNNLLLGKLLILLFGTIGFFTIVTTLITHPYNYWLMFQDAIVSSSSS